MADLCSTAFSIDVSLLSLSVLVSFGIIAIAFIASRIIGDEKVSFWAREEIWNVIADGFIIVFLIIIVSFFKDTSSSLLNDFMESITGKQGILQGDCFYEAAYDYSLSLTASSLELSAANNWALMHLLYLTRISISKCASNSFLICLLGAPQTFIYPFSDLEWATRFLFQISSLLFTTVFLFAFSQLVLIKFFLSQNIVAVLSIMIVMRLIPFTRTFANVLFALILSFYVFYPLLIVLEAYVLGLPNLNSNDLIATDFSSASKLTNDRIPSISQSFLQLSLGTLTDEWKIKGSGTNVIIEDKSGVVINVSNIIEAYAGLIFRVVLFGSINLIIMAVVVRSLLRLLGESNNLMEMFIRMSGIITW